MVAVDIGVWDDDDNFVTDLTLDDLIVTSGGEPVTPAFLRLEGAAEIFGLPRRSPRGGRRRRSPRRPATSCWSPIMLSTSPQDWERILLEVTEFVRAGIQVDDQSRPRDDQQQRRLLRSATTSPSTTSASPKFSRPRSATRSLLQRPRDLVY